MVNVTSKIIGLLNLLKDLNVRQEGPTYLYCDNGVALHITANSVYHECTKHIKQDCYFVRKKIQDGTLKTMHVLSENQLAYLFTKSLHSG